MTKYLFLSFICFVPIGGVVKSEDPKAPTEAELREAKVFDAIGEMISRRDKLLNKFAVVMHGELTTVGGERGVVVRPLVRVRIVDLRRSFDLRASYTVIDNSYETGDEVVKTGKTYKARNGGLILISDYEEKPEKEKLDQWLELHSGHGLDPFDDYLIDANSFSSQRSHRQIEQTILKKYKLLKTERGVGDRLISYWDYFPLKSHHFRFKMEFDPSMEMMLVKNSCVNLVQKKEFQEHRIQWKRQGQTLVPNRIELAIGDTSNETREYTFKCYWLIGDEVPDSIFTAKDHLGAILDHFQITHATVVNGEAVHVVHELPEDLYEHPKK